MDEIRLKVNRVLRREIRGRYDLEGYSGWDLYWEVLQYHEHLFTGRKQSDVVQAAQEWIDANEERTHE